MKRVLASGVGAFILSAIVIGPAEAQRVRAGVTVRVSDAVTARVAVGDGYHDGVVWYDDRDHYRDHDGYYRGRRRVSNGYHVHERWHRDVAREHRVLHRRLHHRPDRFAEREHRRWHRDVSRDHRRVHHRLDRRDDRKRHDRMPDRGHRH